MNKKASNLPKVDREITALNVRLVNSNGDMVGIVPVKDALRMAAEQKLNLVEISPNAEPPVCKIMDFGKYKYEIQKKTHDQRKKQRTVDLKEIKLRPNIGEHDLEIKIRNVLKFLEDGDKVKISLQFRGREMSHMEVGYALFNRVKEKVVEHCKMEYEPRLEGRQIMMIIAPK